MTGRPLPDPLTATPGFGRRALIEHQRFGNKSDTLQRGAVKIEA
jgi:hypothetical protein